ncbi:MAG: hypothetical protein AB1649_05185 [Chloroflexota bacterium]
MMIVAATYISILIGVGSLIWGYAQFGLDAVARWLIIFTAAWLVARWNRWWWFSALGFILSVIVAALGIWFGVSPGWMVASGAFTLIAWDLTDLSQRTHLEKPSPDLHGLQRRHILRDTLLALAALALSSIMMWFRSDLTIEWAIMVAIVFFAGILELLLGFGRH